VPSCAQWQTKRQPHLTSILSHQLAKKGTCTTETTRHHLHKVFQKKWPKTEKPNYKNLLSILYINSLVCASVCRGPETQITFKTVPPTRGPKNYSRLQSHFYFFTPGFKLLTRVPIVKERNGKKKPGAGRATPSHRSHY